MYEDVLDIESILIHWTRHGISLDQAVQLCISDLEREVVFHDEVLELMYLFNKVLTDPRFYERVRGR
jgi:hypothetical protein